jgi:hypothetical protein
VRAKERFSLNIIDEIIANKNEENKFKQKVSRFSSPSQINKAHLNFFGNEIDDSSMFLSNEVIHDSDMLQTMLDDINKILLIK